MTVGEASPEGRSTDRPSASWDEMSEVELQAGSARLPGFLRVPAGPLGVVAFAHGSGSGRHSPRNLAVADSLNERGIATLLFDLLTPEEEADRANVFDIGLLSSRLSAAVDWLQRREETSGLPVGLFGASTGAAAALVSAAELGQVIAAVVSRGGRPDLAGGSLERVRAPTLLIVGGNDPVVLQLNREAAARLRCECALEIVPGATHLFEEPGALERVCDLAAEWFVRHLGAGALSP